MSLPSRTASKTLEELPQDLVDLRSAVERLPVEVRAQLEPLVSKVIDNTRRRRRILNLVQDALGQLRLDMKYLLFDLEATRRERDQYKRQIEGT